jgi:hypothetical protein
MTVFPVIYPTKCGDYFWRRCVLMSSITNPKFSLRSDTRRPRSALHRLPLLPVLDPTRALPGKSICVPINSLSLWTHISYHNVFPDVSYVFPQKIFQVQSWCTQECMWHVDYQWTRLLRSHPPISHPDDYIEQ